jgi:hypothetical protein
MFVCFFFKVIKEEVSMINNNINFEGNMTRIFYEKIVTAAIMSPFEKIINLLYEVFLFFIITRVPYLLVLVTTPTFSIACFHANLTL